MFVTGTAIEDTFGIEYPALDHASTVSRARFSLVGQTCGLDRLTSIRARHGTIGPFRLELRPESGRHGLALTEAGGPRFPHTETKL